MVTCNCLSVLGSRELVIFLLALTPKGPELGMYYSLFKDPIQGFCCADSLYDFSEP